MGLTGSKKKGNSEGEGKIYKLVMLGNGGVCFFYYKKKFKIKIGWKISFNYSICSR